mmetsp:Transcript_2524/g.7481  ORF Transcript_2524/g.7481 Transcript_2524/m.7481 type:complete len:273 (+) Transcript_2524:144-962(+)
MGSEGAVNTRAPTHSDLHRKVLLILHHAGGETGRNQSARATLLGRLRRTLPQRGPWLRRRLKNLLQQLTRLHRHPRLSRADRRSNGRQALDRIAPAADALLLATAKTNKMSHLEDNGVPPLHLRLHDCKRIATRSGGEAFEGGEGEGSLCAHEVVTVPLTHRWVLLVLSRGKLVTPRRRHSVGKEEIPNSTVIHCHRHRPSVFHLVVPGNTRHDREDCGDLVTCDESHKVQVVNYIDEKGTSFVSLLSPVMPGIVGEVAVGFQERKLGSETP